MCTNYVPTRTSILNERFGLQVPTIEFRDEIYPGYLAPIIRRARESLEPDAAECAPAIFGLIPSWSRDGKNYRFCYNARSETVASKPSFRSAWRRNQFCLVPADAFFEPCYETGRPVRWRIERADGQPMGLAAIWEAWRRPDRGPDGKRAGPRDCDLLLDSPDVESQWILSFSLLTINADAHEVMRRFHPAKDEKRTIVAIEPDKYQAWLTVENQHTCDFLHAMDPADLSVSPAPKKTAETKGRRPPKPARKLI